jgi:hypothetical protein
MSSILKVDEIQDTSGNNIINENANTVTIGKAGDTVNVVGTLQNNGSGLLSGITMADQWRLNAHDTVDSSETDLDTGWEQVDTTGFGTIGSAMTQSSGLFTFPSTGIYFVHFEICYYGSAGADYGRAIIRHDNGSGGYSTMVDIRDVVPNGEDIMLSCSVLFDCQNTATDKIIFYGGGNTSNLILGNTSSNKTNVTFIRLGDT